jgi:hypothetical protein
MAGSENGGARPPREPCERFRELAAGHLDRELSPAETEELRRHLEECPDCRLELERQRELKEVIDTMKLPEPPPELWDRYWLGVYNRLERGVAWVLISVAAVIFLGAAAYHLILALFTEAEMPVIMRVGLGCGVAGLAILFVSVLRERLFVRGKDKYREVVR